MFIFWVKDRKVWWRAVCACIAPAEGEGNPMWDEVPDQHLGRGNVRKGWDTCKWSIPWRTRGKCTLNIGFIMWGYIEWRCIHYALSFLRCRFAKLLCRSHLHSYFTDKIKLSFLSLSILFKQKFIWMNTIFAKSCS